MARTSRSFAFLFALLWFLAGCASPALQTAPSPEEVGLSSPRLRAMHADLQAKVDAGLIPGAVILVARDNKIAWYEAAGFRDREARTPLRRDDLFRLASMTKPITTLAAMILVEEGKLRLDDPVSLHLPEFADLQVGREMPGSDGRMQLVMERARRAPTVADLMRHTSGITYGIFGQSLVKTRYNAANLFDVQQTTQDFAIKVSSLPLQYQPGTKWDYGMSVDVLARVVEVASGMPVDRFIRTRILAPLKMNDTAYYVDAAQRDRIAEPQVVAATGRRTPMQDHTVHGKWIPGGHGLVGTAADYARLCQMILNRGTLDGVRIVSKATIDRMRTDQLPRDITPQTQAEIDGWSLMGPNAANGNGFGLGFLVRTSQGTNNIPGSIGDISWGGATGPYFWIDPKQRLFAVVMMQAPTPVNRPLRLWARQHVYGALQ